MPKKRSYSDTFSKGKLEDVIASLIARGFGGVATLDRDIQLQLQRLGASKAEYWARKYGLYHAIKLNTQQVLKEYGVPTYLWGAYYAVAQKVGKAIATAHEEVRTPDDAWPIAERNNRNIRPVRQRRPENHSRR
jgi:hypothetical protein